MNCKKCKDYKSCKAYFEESGIYNDEWADIAECCIDFREDDRDPYWEEIYELYGVN